MLPDERLLFQTSIIGNMASAEQMETRGITATELAMRKLEQDEKISQADYLEKRNLTKLSASATKLAVDYEDLTNELLQRMELDRQGKLYG